MLRLPAVSVCVSVGGWVWVFNITTHTYTHTHSLARTHQSTPVEDIDLVKDPHIGIEVSHCMGTEVSHHLSRSRHVRTSTSSVSPVGGRDIPLRIGPMGTEVS